jgi:benzoylformate decarboxylase
MRGLGLTTVFGNPGTTEVPFLSDWPDDFRYVLGLQESVVVAMADGYAQLSGEPVLVNLHSAGGVGHALGSVFTAFRNRTPLIVLAGQQARPLVAGEPFLGATDAAQFPRPYVKWSVEPARAQDVPGALAHAHQLAVTAPRGPVFLSVPVDDWHAAAEPLAVPAPVPGAVVPPDVVADVARAVSAAAHPVLVVGPAVDADGAVEDVVVLAERAGAPVWAAPMSPRCSFPEDHPLFAGFLTPERGAVGAAMAAHDLVVVLGAPAFTYHVERPGPVPPFPPMFLVSDDPELLARAPHARGVLGAVGPAVRALAAALPERTGRSEPASVRARAARPGPSSPMTAAYVMDALARLLPPDAVVVEEAPTHRDAMHEHLPIRRRDAGFLTTASGALGYGIAAAVGAALARPDRPVVAVLGDGSSMYGIQALWTAAREGAAVTFVVLDNAEYAAVRLLGEAAGATKLPGVALGGIDFVAVARGLGCAAHAVTDPGELDAALRAALAEPGPTLLHLPVAAQSVTPY